MLYNINMFNWQMPDLGILIFIIVIWEAFWKGIGLWKSAKKADQLWFLAIFLINFVGLVPIFYLWKTKQLDGIFQDTKHLVKSRFKRSLRANRS